MHHQGAHLGISLKEAVVPGCEESVHQRVGGGLGGLGSGGLVQEACGCDPPQAEHWWR